MSQKRVFQRPGMVGEEVRGPTTASLPTSPSPHLNALQRISSLRQALSNVVASHFPSSARNSTPQFASAFDSLEKQENTASLLLASSQRRFEQLLQDNHKLELLCMEQQNTIKEIKMEMSMNSRCSNPPLFGGVGGPHVTEAGAAAAASSAPVGKPEQCAGLTTRSMPHRTHAAGTRGSGKAAARHSGTVVATGAAGVNRCPSVSAELDDAVQQLVSVAISVFPELEARMESISRSGGDEMAAACDVLQFIESHLEEWSEGGRAGDASVEGVGVVVSQVLSSVRTQQEEWCSLLVDLVDRLQLACGHEREMLFKKDKLIAKMRKEVKALSTELSEAVEVRMQCECRCAELEDALSRLMRDQVAHDTEVRRLKHEYEALRSEANLLKLQAEKNFAGNGVGEERDRQKDHNWNEMHLSNLHLSKERDELEARLQATKKALLDAQSQIKAMEEERQALQAGAPELRSGEQETLRDAVSVLPTSTISADDPKSRLNEPLLNDCCTINDGDVPVAAAVALFLPIIRELEVDIFSLSENHEVKATGLLFHVTSAIVKDMGLMEDLLQPPESLAAWNRLVVYLQNKFPGSLFHNADRAADNMQLFYAFMCHSGMIEHMNPVELLATVLAALCTMFRDVDIPDERRGAAPAAAAGGSRRNGGTTPLEVVLLGRSCSYETLCALMEWEHFDFAVQWEPEGRAVLLRTVRDLLLSQELLAQLECLIYSTGISVSDGGKWEPQLHDEAVRHQFVRLLLTFAQYAFATRPFAVSKYWANERFSLYLLQRGLTNKPEMNHTEVAQRAEAVADAQVLLLNSTVIPLCHSAVRVFPALQPCLTALQTNLSMWRSCSSDRGDDLCASDSQTPNKQGARSGDAATFDLGGFKLVSSDRVERGTVLADTEGFISTQEQIRSLCGENAALQKLIAQLFSEIDMARKRGVEIG